MEIMKRVLIIGCSGSGKSTLAGKLAELTNLPVLNLDQLYWKPSWTIPDEKEWLASLTRALEEAGWIMDGHYSATLSTRLERADTVILLDFPPRICVFRAFSRMLRNHGNTRSDMANNCPEEAGLGVPEVRMDFSASDASSGDEATQCFSWPVDRVANSRRGAPLS